MKKLFLLLAIPFVLRAADTTGTWNSAGGNRMDSLAAYSWSPATPSGFTGDVVLVFSSGSVAATSGGNLSVKSVTTSSGYSGNWSISGYTLTTNGNASFDGTGTLHLGNAITVNGASAAFHLGSGVGTIVASFCDLTLNGITGMTLDDDKAGYTTFKSFTLGASAKVTNTGSGSGLIFSNSTTPFILGNSSTFTNSQRLNIVGTGSCCLATIGSSVTFNGASEIHFYIGTSSVNDTVPGFSFSGSALIYVNDLSGSLTGWSVTLSGNIVTNGDLSIAVSQASSTGTFNINDKNITCQQLYSGVSNANNTGIFNFGSGTYTISTLTGSVNGAGTIRDSLKNSTWNCSNNWTYGSNHKIYPGGSTVNFTGATKSIVTAIDTIHSFYNVNVNKSSSAVCTLSGTTRLKCYGEFKATAGKVYLPCSLSCYSYTNLTTDTLSNPKPKYIQTSFYRSSTAVKSDTSSTYFTDAVRHDIHSDTSYTLSRFVIQQGTANWQTGAKILRYYLPIASKSTHISGGLFEIDSAWDIEGTLGNLDTLVSSTPGSRFILRLSVDDTLRYIAFKDCSSKTAILCDSCADLGNNINITFTNKLINPSNSNFRSSGFRFGWRRGFYGVWR
jgi:hypothetical protein